MGRQKSALGYLGSRYNRLSHGVMLHKVLPSRGPEKCWYRHDCPVAQDDDIRSLCRPGYPCPVEQVFLERYVESAKITFTECLDWMTKEERDQIVYDLGILSLRRRRLSALIAYEGFIRPKRHPVSGYEYGVESALGIGRYMTSIDTQWEARMDALLSCPT